ncbi:hypothetical protein AQUCO_00700933v1 [Aquilegia coerulea]|uniref:Uncharacterized protein n=1 Tax=Aquilegia coerulea TaxID=218851 RepID=A0A2G5EMB0_AQUCA|nr:hypothetical protein AQUCO_00700933v1 [Aquilegia coerulea]
MKILKSRAKKRTSRKSGRRERAGETKKAARSSNERNWTLEIWKRSGHYNGFQGRIVDINRQTVRSESESQMEVVTGKS